MGFKLAVKSQGMVAFSWLITGSRCRLPSQGLAHGARTSLAYATLQTYAGVVFAFA